MVGFIYNNEDVKNDDIMVSELVVSNSKYLFKGFILGMCMAPRIAFADE